MQEKVEYLGHTLSGEGIAKGLKVEAVINVSMLKTFLGSEQFYGKFIHNLTMLAGLLFRLTKKATPWKWNNEE